MINFNNKEVWFLIGSQNLYGEDTLLTVTNHGNEIVNYFNSNNLFPVPVKLLPTIKSSEEVTTICNQANFDTNCIGLIVWMHTFSPAKMWINGLSILTKPLLHLHTQFNRDIPFADIDMDFMNLNQSAHGDREFAHLLTKMKIKRSIVIGHWQSSVVHKQMHMWCRCALGLSRIKEMKTVRFGDNMRYVAVTDGDKVSAQQKFGFSVNTYPVGDLVQYINDIPTADINDLMEEYEKSYILPNSLLIGGIKRQSLFEAAQIELGIQSFLIDGGYQAFTNTFEDLHGMKQLPGIGSQRLMSKGYGFGAEGDWKTASLLHVMKYMSYGLEGGNSFMEDYTYHFEPNKEMVLGSHMLEICPSIADDNINCEIHALAIGGKDDPVRLVFNAKAGPAINVSLIDLGHRFRMIVHKVEGLAITEHFPKLPTARALWKSLPSMEIGLQAWLLAGGAHHTVYSQNIDVDMMRSFGEMLDVETIIIDENTNIPQLVQELRINDVYYK